MSNLFIIMGRKTGLVIICSCIFIGVKGAHFRTEEEFDVLSDVSTSVRCSKSKLSVSKADVLYTWEMEGFLSYLRYLRDFGLKEFRHSTGKIVYDSEKINGEWNFELHSNGKENFVTGTYTYQENKDNQNGNFGIKLKIIQPNFDSITFPVQKPTDVTREKVFINSGNVKDKGTSYIFSYPSSEEDTDREGIETVTLKFRWPAISTTKFLDFQFENTDLIFAFMIHAYFPAEAKTFRKSACNLDNLESKYLLRQSESNLGTASLSECSEKNNFVPLPVNSTAMFASPVFSDIVVRVENIDIPAHGVILYHSSPRLASLILNAAAKQKLITDNGTFSDSGNHSHAVIDISEDIGYNGTYEMLRYIYTGKAENLTEYAHKIIIAADRYDLPGLKSICEQSLISNANLSNVINLYVLGIDVSSSRLVRKAFAVIQANRASIVSQSEEFRKLSVKYPNLMFELFIT